MKSLYNVLSWIIRIIALVVFASGIVLTFLGGLDFVYAFTYFNAEKGMVGLVAIALLQSIDLFLIAIVFFVFSIGILILFDDTSKIAASVQLPSWLKIRDFTELKVILWEAILTTLVVSFLAGLVQRRLNGEELGMHNLIIPAAILLIGLSLFLLKQKGDKHH